jgi:hypothetical protein
MPWPVGYNGRERETLFLWPTFLLFPWSSHESFDVIHWMEVSWANASSSFFEFFEWHCSSWLYFRSLSYSCKRTGDRTTWKIASIQSFSSNRTRVTVTCDWLLFLIIALEWWFRRRWLLITQKHRHCNIIFTFANLGFSGIFLLVSCWPETKRWWGESKWCQATHVCKKSQENLWISLLISWIL